MKFFSVLIIFLGFLIPNVHLNYRNGQYNWYNNYNNENCHHNYPTQYPPPTSKPDPYTTTTTTTTTTRPPPVPLKCGIKGKPKQVVPYGGVDQTAEMFEFPWQVIIKTDEPGAVPNPITCEASIIDKFWVITSVNCVNQTQMEKFTLRFASYKLKNPDKFEFSRKINKIVVHPNFNPLTLNSNIALLKLPSELPFGNVSAHVSAICLPAMERDIDEQANLIKIATISGWNKQKVVEELLTTNVTILKQSECVVPAKSVTQENICSRGQLSTGLACNHFNGGPLITYDNLKNQWQLIGVASFSECSTFPVPNVYTRVSKYLDWIMKTMSEN